MSNDSRQERIANAKANVRRLQRELAEALDYLRRCGGDVPASPCCEAAHRAGRYEAQLEAENFERNLAREN